MTHTIHPTAAHAIETDSTRLHHSPGSTGNYSTTRLFARWELIDHKLVYKWLLAE